MDDSRLRIGELAARAAVKIDTLRYYERRGLLPVPVRSTAGYRAYTPDAVQRVRFIQRAQALGFTLQEIADLLTLRADSTLACEAVEVRARAALGRIESKLDDLTRMRRGLQHYIGACQRHDPLDTCPLLRELGGPETNE